MLKTSYFRQRSLCLGTVILLCASGIGAQSPPPLLIQRIPVGQRPLGVEVVGVELGGGAGVRGLAAVANSGDNSVSILEIKVEFKDPSAPGLGIISPYALIRGIPSPYAVVPCTGYGGEGLFLVTSPSADSVSLIDAVKGTVVATVKVGSQPYSGSCQIGGGVAGAVVSNYGDNSLSVLAAYSFTVTKTIPNVPGSRGLHGVTVFASETRPIVWVAGTDADVVTLVDVNASTVLTKMPVRKPTTVGCCIFGVSIPHFYIASSADNSILAIVPSTLQAILTIPNVPTPQDFGSSFLGNFASTGAGNSLAWIIGLANVTLIPGIPGAAGVVSRGVDPAIFTTGGPRTPPYTLVTSPDSNSVFFLQAQPQTPRQFSAVGASFGAAGVAPSGLASTFATTGVSQNFSAGSLPLPKTLGGVTLRFGGSLTFDSTNARWNYSPVGSIDAALLFVGPTQINFQLPPGISPGDSVPTQLTKPDGTSLLTTVRITATAPGIFTVLQNGQGQAAVLNENNSQNFGTNPAQRGSVIQVYATGAGETDPPLLPGEPAPTSGNPLILTRVQPTVTIGGIEARVLFSGMAPGFVGLWQINAEVPASVVPGSAVSLVVSAGGVSSNTVSIAVE